MTRPPAGPPPVERSAVARREPDSERRDLVVYRQVSDVFRKEERRGDLRAMLGSDDLVDRFLAVALASIARDSDLLLNADPLSIIQAIRDSATLGLEPTGLTGEAVILRYGRQAKLMPMWRGYLKRIRNSRKVQDIDVQVVYTNDAWEYGYTERGGWFKHTPAKATRNEEGTEYLTERGGYWGVYAYAVMPSGFVELEVMDADEINFVRDTFSPSYKDGRGGPWATSYGEMARKTVIRRLAKRLPQEAVDQLLAIEAQNEQAEAEETANARPLSVSKARNAALAALGQRVDDNELLPSGSGVMATVELAATTQTATAVAEAPAEPAPSDPNEPPLFDGIPFDE